MTDRLKQQLDFILEIDQEKIFSGKPTSPTTADGKTMRNMPGI